MKTFLLDLSVRSCALIGHFTALDVNILSLFLVFVTLAEGHSEDVKPCPGFLL